MDTLTSLAQIVKDHIGDYTICAGESLTGGLVGNALARVSGSSGYYLGTLCAYNIDIKVRLLGVDRAQATTCDCVSLTTASEMALGACDLFGGRIGLSCTGYVSPTENSPVPFCYWAIAVDGEIRDHGRLDFPSHEINPERYLVQRGVAACLLSRLVTLLSRLG